MLFCKILFIILYSALMPRRDITILLAKIVIITNILIIYLNFKTFYLITLDKGICIYNGVFHFNATTHMFNIFILLLTTIIISFNSFYPRKILKDKSLNLNKENITLNSLKLNLTATRQFSTTTTNKNGLNEIHQANEIILGKDSEQFKIKEYVLILSFIIMGAIFLMSTNDLISIFLAIELQSYGLYLLSTIYRDSELSTKAGLTYFLLGGLASCIILLGQALLYINCGNTNMDNNVLSNITLPILEYMNIGDIHSVSEYFFITYDYYYINLSLIILSVGFLFKASAAPFHFWSPDVYDSIPTIVTVFVAIIAKISIFIFFFRFSTFYFKYTSRIKLSK